MIFYENVPVCIQIHIPINYTRRNKNGYINFDWGGGYVDYLKSNDGAYIFPITKIESVYDNSGNTLQSILDNKQPLGDYAASSHLHSISNIDGLQIALDGKQPVGSYLGSTATAVAANKLATARTLTIGNTGKSFDGSGNVSWSLTEIGAAASSHSHSYLPLSGGTMTGVFVSKGSYIHVNRGGSGAGTAGYFKLCTIVISHSYQNVPITFVIVERGRNCPMFLSVVFTNSGTADSNLYNFTFFGTDYSAYIVKETTSTWTIYVTKSEGWDSLCICDIWHHHNYMTGVSITYYDETVTSLPSGCTRATGHISTSWNYYQDGTAGQISAVQSGSPNSKMLWAY